MRARRARRTRRPGGLRRLRRSRAHPTGVGQHRGGMVNTARRRTAGCTRRIPGPLRIHGTRRLRRTRRTRRLRRSVPLRGPAPRGAPLATRTPGPLRAECRHELRGHVTARRSTRRPGPRRRRRRTRPRTRRPRGTRRRRRGRTRAPPTPRRRSRLAGGGVRDVPGVRSERPPGRTLPGRRLRPTGGTIGTGRTSGTSSLVHPLRIPVRPPTRPGRRRTALRRPRHARSGTRPRRIAVPRTRRTSRPGSPVPGSARMIHRRRDRSRRQLTAARHQGRLCISGRRRGRRIVTGLTQRRREDRRGQRHGTVVPGIGVGVRTGPGRRPGRSGSRGRSGRRGRRSRSPGSPRLGPLITPPGSRPRRTTPRRDRRRPRRGSSPTTGRSSGSPRRGTTRPGRSSIRPRSSPRSHPGNRTRSPTRGSPGPSPDPPPIRNPQLVRRVLQPLRRSQQERRLVQIHPRGRRRRCRLLRRVRTAVLLLVPADHLTHRQPGPQRRLAAVPRDHQPLRAPVRTRPVRPVLGPHHEPQVELPHPHLTVLVRRHVPVDPLFRALLRLREGHHR